VLGAPDLIGSREAYCYISLTSQDFGLAKCKLAWYNRSVGEVAASAHPKFTPYTLQAMSSETADPRSTLIELAEKGRLSWELIATEFIMASSSDDAQDVLDILTDNY
jgi:hypothetical protein